MRIGISTACLYPSLTEDALKALGEAGIKNTEIFVNSPSELESGFVYALKDIKDRYGMNILSLHPYSSFAEPFMLFSDYKRRYKDTVEAYKRYFAAMNILGAKILVLHGDRKDSNLPEEECFERFAGLYEAGRQFGITVAQENVYRYRSSQLSFIKRMKKALPFAEFVLDIKQAIRSGEDPFEMLAAMGSSICHVHLSDSAQGADCLPMGKGHFDLKRLFLALAALGFSGGVLLEVYNGSYGNFDELLESHRKTLDVYSSCRL